MSNQELWRVVHELHEHVRKAERRAWMWLIMTLIAAAVILILILTGGANGT